MTLSVKNAVNGDKDQKLVTRTSGASIWLNMRRSGRNALSIGVEAVLLLTEMP